MSGWVTLQESKRKEAFDSATHASSFRFNEQFFPSLENGAQLKFFVSLFSSHKIEEITTLVFQKTFKVIRSFILQSKGYPKS